MIAKLVNVVHQQRKPLGQSVLLTNFQKIQTAMSAFENKRAYIKN
jgi:hypothetical protein